MTDLLCLAERCRIYGQHATGCTDGTCVGCVPWRAADGLRLCTVHTDKIGTDAIRAAELHGELALVLTGAGGGGPKVSGGSVHKDLNFNELAGDVRAEIRAVLVSWTKLIADERGFTLPADRVTDLGGFVASSYRWLAANDLAATASAELENLVQIARPVAYPSGTRRFAVAGCPECGSDLMAVLRNGSALPHEVVCAEDVEHAWGRDAWIELGVAVAARRPETVARERLRAGTVGNGGWQTRRAA